MEEADKYSKKQCSKRKMELMSSGNEFAVTGVKLNSYGIACLSGRNTASRSW